MPASLTSAKNSLMHGRLSELKGKQAIVVMKDQRAFKGTVGDFDQGHVFLRDVVEGSTVNTKGWEEVTIQSGYVNKRVTRAGSMTVQEPGQLVRLKDVLISLEGVLRVWEWERGNMAKPEHTQVERTDPVF